MMEETKETAPKLKVTIIGTNTGEDRNGVEFTVYLLQCAQNAASTSGDDAAASGEDPPELPVVPMRYSELLKMHQHLSQEFVCLPPFPAKTVSRSIDKSFVEHRKAALQLYLNRLTRRWDISRSERVQQLLGIIGLDEHKGSVMDPNTDSHRIGDEMRGLSFNTNEEHDNFQKPFFSMLEKCSTEPFRANDVLVIADGRAFAVATGDPSALSKLDAIMSSWWRRVSNNDETTNSGATGSVRPLGGVALYRKLDTSDSMEHEKVLVIPIEKEVTALAWDSDRQWLYAGTTNGMVHAYHPSPDFAYAVPSFTINVGPDPIEQMTYDDSSDTLMTVCKSGTIGVIDVNQQLLRFVLEYTKCSLFSIAHYPAPNLLFVGGFNSVLIWRKHEAQSYFNLVQFLKEHAGAVRAVEYSAERAMLVTGSDDQSICLWTISDESISEQQSQLTARLLGHSSGITCLRLSADSKWLVSGDASGNIAVWNLTNPQRVEIAYAFNAHMASISSINFRDDVDATKQIITSSVDSSIKLWAVRVEEPQSS